MVPTWSGRGARCQESHEQQEQVGQAEDPHGWVGLCVSSGAEVGIILPKREQSFSLLSWTDDDDDDDALCDNVLFSPLQSSVKSSRLGCLLLSRDTRCVP